MSEPKIEPIDNGVRVTCTCGNSVEVRLEAPDQKIKKPSASARLQLFIPMFLAGAAGAGVSLLGSKLGPVPYLLITVVWVFSLVFWLRRMQRQTRRETKEYMDNVNALRQQINRRENARWQ